MNRCLLSVLALVIIMVSCRDPYPGYKKAGEGIYYKLLKIGEQEKPCHYGDYVTTMLTYKTMNDSIFYSGMRRLKVIKPDFPGSIDHCLTMMHENDSAEFIISALDFFEKTLGNVVPPYITANGMMKLDIGLLKIQNEKEHALEQEMFMSWIENPEEYEKIILTQYIEENRIITPPTEDGIYYVVLQEGNERAIKSGDTIAIHYEGRFLNGNSFDSTRIRNAVFQFIYGQEWQVIPGIEKAVKRMHEGSKALVIIPSEYAFGTTGSSTGVIPPYTPVIYEIEVISVR